MSTPAQEAVDRFDKSLGKHSEILTQIAVVARNLIPTLKDHNLSNTAKPLEELFFQLDANRQEQEKMFHDNPRLLIEALMGRLRGQV